MELRALNHTMHPANRLSSPGTFVPLIVTLMLGLLSTSVSAQTLNVGPSNVTTNFTSGTNVYTGINIGTTGSGNSLGISGPGTLITDGGASGNPTWFLGTGGSNNSLVISNGGSLNFTQSRMGGGASGNGNSLIVTGSNSLLKLTLPGWSSHALDVAGSSNNILVANGGVLSGGADALFFGSGGGNNSFLVTGQGSRVTNFEVLVVGHGSSSFNNSLRVSSNGVVSVANLQIGYLGGPNNSNSLTVDSGGAVNLANALYLSYLSGNSNNTISVSGSNSTLSAVANWLGHTGGGNRVTIDDGGTLRGGYDSIGLKATSSNNSVLVTGAGSLWTCWGALNVGNDGAGNLLTIANGGMMNDPDGTLGNAATSSNNSVLVTGNGSLWANSGNLLVGNNGAGNLLTITNGGTVRDGNGTLGNAATSSNNSVLVTGSDSIWTNSGYILLGASGSGNSLTIADGGRVFSANGYMAQAPSSNNSVIVDGGLWSVANQLEIGSQGALNSLTITNGGTVKNAYGFLGFSATSSNNSVLVTGSKSIWTNAGYILIGASGSGNSLTIKDGGSVFSANGYVAGTPSSNNSVTVDGGLWSVANQLEIGSQGFSNRLRIANGGIVKNANGVLGFSASSSNNSVLVTGSSSLWTNSGNLFVGNAGAGNSMTISNRATVRNAIGYLGFHNSSSNNSVLVTGSGSLWTNSGNLFVGNAGAGNSMTISNGGGVWSLQGTIGASASSSNNRVTVDGSGSYWTTPADLYVGSEGGNNSLVISHGGSVTSLQEIYVGHKATSSNNSLTVTGANSILGQLSGDPYANIYVGGYGSGNRMTVSDGATMTNDGGFYIGVGARNGIYSDSNTVLVTGMGSKIVSVGQFNEMADWGSGNRLIISNGGSVSLGGEGFWLSWDPRSVSNSVIVTGNQSILSTTNEVYLGMEGSGNTVLIEDGAVFNNAGSSWLSYVFKGSVASNNSVLVTGTGSTWSNSGSLTIGYAGSGTLTIGSGGTVAASDLTIAALAGAAGTVNFGTSGGSDTNMSLGTGAIAFGAGPGSLNFNQADAFSNAYAVSSGSTWQSTIAQLGSGTTTLTLNGTTPMIVAERGKLILQGGTVTDGGDIIVGKARSGASVEISGGASYELLGDTYLGYGASSSNNTLLVTSNSHLKNYGDSTYVGYEGAGNTLVISNGSSVAQYEAFIGYGDHSSNNTLIIAGSGSLTGFSVNDPTDVYVGMNGSGNRLIITNGGMVHAWNTDIGFAPSSSNNSVLVGSGGLLRNEGYVFVGTAGNGTLTIAANGTVDPIGIILGQVGSRASGTFNLGTLGGNDTNISLTVSFIQFGSGSFSGTNASYLNFNQADTLVISAEITSVNSPNGTVQQLGSGTTILTGDNSYAGRTLITNGTLMVNGTHTGGAGYTVTNSGTLGGIGRTTSAVTVGANGTVRPGNGTAPGVLTVGGLTLNSGGTLNILLGGSVSSLLEVSGSVSLAGAVTFTTNAPLTADLYPFLSYTGSHAGTFAQTNNLPNGFDLIYDANDKVDFLARSAGALEAAPLYTNGNAIIRGGSNTFGVFVYNATNITTTFAVASASNTTGSIGSQTLGSHDGTNAGSLTFSSTTVGTNEGTFVVTNSTAGNAKTNTVQFLVYDHADGSLPTNALDLGEAIVGYTNPLTGSLTVSNADGFRVAMETRSSSTNNNLDVEDVSGVMAGSSGELGFNLSGQGVGTMTTAVTITYADSSALNGASANVGSGAVTVTAKIYDHAQGSLSVSNLAFAPVHAGYTNRLTTTTSLTVSNAAGYRVALATETASTNPFLELGNVANLISGHSANVSATLEEGQGPGFFTNAVIVTYADSSNLNGASTNVGTAVVLVSGYVYSGQGVWTSTNGGNWTNFANWQVLGGTPGLDGALSANDTATFGSAGGGAVTLDTNASLASLVFSNASSSYTVTGSGTLTLADGTEGEKAIIANEAGTHTITTAALDFASTTTVSNTIGSHLIVDAPIRGSGGLTQEGGGTMTLNGSNTYTGATILNGGGTLQVNGSITHSSSVEVNDGTLAPGLQGITVNGPVAFTSANSRYQWTLFDNTTNGPGSNFTAPLVLSDTLSVNGGVFSMFLTSNVMSTNSFWNTPGVTNSWTVMKGGDITAGTGFDITFAPGSHPGLSSSYFFWTVVGNDLVLNYSFGSSGDLIARTTTTVVDDMATYPTVSFEPDGKLEITQTGDLTITGHIDVPDDGTVVLNGILNAPAGVTCQQCAIFMGSGGLNGDLVNQGRIKPGNSPGTLTINGNMTQTTTGMTEIEVESQSNFDHLVVNGSASLAGGLQVTTYGGGVLAYGNQYQFLTASGGISGTYDWIAAPAGYRARFFTQANGTKGAFVIAPQSYTQMATTPNQMSVAKALDTFIPGSVIPAPSDCHGFVQGVVFSQTPANGDKSVVSLALDRLTAGQYAQAFAAISPTLYQSLSTMAFNAANAQYNDLVEQMFGLRVAGSGFSMNGFGDNVAMIQEGQGDGVLDSKKDILRAGEDNRWGMFVDGNGIFAQANSGNMLQNYNAQSGGLIAGLTYKWNPAVTTGIYAGYEGTYAKYGYPYSGSTVIDNAVRFGLLGTYGEPSGRGFYGDALVGGTYNNYTVTRAITFPGMNRTANSSPGAGELDSLLAVGYNWRKGNWAFGPVSSLQYTYFGMNSFGETGAQSLDYQGLNWNTASMIYNLGANCAYSWQATRNLAVVPQVNLAWQHEFMQNPYAINGTLSGTPVVNTSSAPLRDTLYTGVGVTLEYKKRWNTAFFYNAAAGNSDLVSQNIFWSAGVKF